MVLRERDAERPVPKSMPIMPLKPGRVRGDITILVVDNDPEDRRIVRDGLSGEGYRFLEADGVDSAVAILTKERVDLITTDFNMRMVSDPRSAQTGADLLRWRDLNRKGIPAIFVSSHGLTPSLSRAFGAKDLIAKPAEGKRLKAAVNRLLERRETV